MPPETEPKESQGQDKIPLALIKMAAKPEYTFVNSNKQ